MVAIPSLNQLGDSTGTMAVRLLLLLSVLALASCNGGCDFAIAVLPEKMAVDDPRLQPMYEAIAQRTDRPMMGFTPLPAGDQAKDVRLQALPVSGYDAMLYVVGKSSRRVAFKRKQQGYEWLGEQEIFAGPRSFSTADGRVNEAITITFHLPPMEGPHGLHVSYAGEEQMLATKSVLSLEDVEPWLKKWDYK